MFWIKTGYFLRNILVNYLEIPNDIRLLRNYLRIYYILLILTFFSFIFWLLYTITDDFFLKRWIDHQLIDISYIVTLSITLFPIVLWLIKLLLKLLGLQSTNAAILRYLLIISTTFFLIGFFCSDVKCKFYQLYLTNRFILFLILLLFLTSFLLFPKRSIFIGEFKDLRTKNDEENHKIGYLLAAELNRLKRLYLGMDNQHMWALPRGLSVPREIIPPVKVLGGVFSDLDKLGTVEVSGPPGKLSFAIQPLIRIVQWLTGVRRICGSIQEKNGVRIIIAEIEGERKSPIFRIDGHHPFSNDKAPPVQRDIEDQIEELACCIFAEITLQKNVLIPALRQFNEGLRSYDDAVRNPKNRYALLLDAEQHFKKAVFEDDRFDIAFYHLGTVYQQLEMTARANQMYHKAIERQSDNWLPYFALASMKFEPLFDTYAPERRLSRPIPVDKVKIIHIIINLCNRALMIEKDSRIYTLKSLACMLLGDDKAFLKIAMESVKSAYARLPASDSNVQSIVKDEQGKPFSLEGLCAISLQRAAEACFRNLKFTAAQCSINLTVKFQPWNPQVHFLYGDILYADRYYQEAEIQYRYFLQIHPASRGAHALLAASIMRQNKIDNSKDLECKSALEKALTCPSSWAPDILELLHNALKKRNTILNDQIYKKADVIVDIIFKIENMFSLKNGFIKDLNCIDLITSVKNDLNILEKKDRQKWYRWICGIFMAYRGRQLYNQNNFSSSVIALSCAYSLLEKDFKDEIEYQKINPILAYVYSQSDKFDNSFQLARDSLRMYPLGSLEHLTLGDYFYKKNDFKLSLNRFNEALSLLPPKWRLVELWTEDFVLLNRYLLFFKIGRCLIILSERYGNRKDRQHQLDQGIQSIKCALELSPKSSNLANNYCLMHFWLGKGYFHRDEFEEAAEEFDWAKHSIESLRISSAYSKDHSKSNQNQSFQLMLARYHAGWAYERAHYFSKAAEIYKKIFDNFDETEPKEFNGDSEEFGGTENGPSSISGVAIFSALRLAFILIKNQYFYDDPSIYLNKATEWNSRQQSVDKIICAQFIKILSTMINYDKINIDSTLNILLSFPEQSRNLELLEFLEQLYLDKYSSSKSETEQKSCIVRLKELCQDVKQIDLGNRIYERMICTTRIWQEIFCKV